MRHFCSSLDIWGLYFLDQPYLICTFLGFLHEELKLGAWEAARFTENQVSWVLKMAALDLPFFLGSWWKCSGSWSPEALGLRTLSDSHGKFDLSEPGLDLKLSKFTCFKQREWSKGHAVLPVLVEFSPFCPWPLARKRWWRQVEKRTAEQEKDNQKRWLGCCRG